MAIVTNKAQGPRMFNVWVDGHIEFATLAPGETRAMNLHGIDSKVIKGMIASREIEIDDSDDHRTDPAVTQRGQMAALNPPDPAGTVTQARPSSIASPHATHMPHVVTPTSETDALPDDPPPLPLRNRGKAAPPAETAAETA
jgi:hypothetical protein